MLNHIASHRPLSQLLKIYNAMNLKENYGKLGLRTGYPH